MRHYSKLWRMSDLRLRIFRDTVAFMTMLIIIMGILGKVIPHFNPDCYDFLKTDDEIISEMQTERELSESLNKIRKQLPPQPRPSQHDIAWRIVIETLCEFVLVYGASYFIAVCLEKGVTGNPVSKS